MLLKMKQIQSVEDLANQAGTQYCVARSLKIRGKYQKAFEYFKMAARKYEELSNHEDISAGQRLGYLEKQRECLESMLVDAFSCNLSLWANIMLKLKEIDEHSCSVHYSIN